MITRFLFCFFLLIFFSQCNTDDTVKISFREFLLLENSYSHANNLYDRKEFDSAIWYFRKSAVSVNSNYASNINIARCYANLEQFDSALYYTRLAFKQGFPWDYLAMDTTLFMPIWKEMRLGYRADSLEYIKQINLALRHELQGMYQNDQAVRQKSSVTISIRDSIDRANITRLKELTDEYGWPERSVQGFGMIVDPSIFVIHADEAANLYFLPIAIKSAEENKSGWYSPRSIMNNMLWRFEDSGYNKLRFIVPIDGSILNDKSFFQLKSLSQFIIDNDFKIKINAHRSTDTNFNREYKKYLLELKFFLLENGVENKRVMINDTLLENDRDEFGTYLFSYSRLH